MVLRGGSTNWRISTALSEIKKNQNTQFTNNLPLSAATVGRGKCIILHSKSIKPARNLSAIFFGSLKSQSKSIPLL